MKRILFAIAGAMMVLALVAAAPGTAGAVPLPVSTSVTLVGVASAEGASAYVLGDSITINEGPDVKPPFANVTGLMPAFLLTDVATGRMVSISGFGSSKATISIVGDQATFRGSFADETLTPSGSGYNATYTTYDPFSITGTVTAFAKNNGYAWNIFFSNLTGLSNNVFSVANGTFTGSLTLSTNGITSNAAALSSTVSTVPVPVPPSLMFFAPGLLSLIGIRKRLKG
jgi:hypothetical protein